MATPDDASTGQYTAFQSFLAIEVRFVINAAGMYLVAHGALTQGQLGGLIGPFTQEILGTLTMAAPLIWQHLKEIDSRLWQLAARRAPANAPGAVVAAERQQLGVGDLMSSGASKREVELQLQLDVLKGQMQQLIVQNEVVKNPPHIIP